jgi:hypothetical protein
MLGVYLEGPVSTLIFLATKRSLIVWARPTAARRQTPEKSSSVEESWHFAAEASAPHGQRPAPLDFAVVLVVFVITMAEVFHRAERAAIGGVSDFDPAVHIF